MWEPGCQMSFQWKDFPIGIKPGIGITLSWWLYLHNANRRIHPLDLNSLHPLTVQWPLREKMSLSMLTLQLSWVVRQIVCVQPPPLAVNVKLPASVAEHHAAVALLLLRDGTCCTMPTAIDQYLLPARHSATWRCCYRSIGQTDRWMDRHTDTRPLHKPCYAASIIWNEKCTDTQTSRLNTVRWYQSGVQGTCPNHRLHQDQCELDSYNYKSPLSKSCNTEHYNTFH